MYRDIYVPEQAPKVLLFSSSFVTSLVSYIYDQKLPVKPLLAALVSSPICRESATL